MPKKSEYKIPKKNGPNLGENNLQCGGMLICTSRCCTTAIAGFFIAEATATISWNKAQPTAHA